MPRYFFHLKQGDRVLLDREGIYLSDLTTARVEVIESIREVLSEPGLEYEDIDGQTFEISDEAGETVLIVPF